MATVNINVAAGADQPTLNALVIQVYKGIYPNIFKNSINVGQAGILLQVCYRLEAFCNRPRDTKKTGRHSSRDDTATSL